MCDLELIYLHALFDIMIHLVIHLSLEALDGGPSRPRWMFTFERYMKKLKGYDVTMKFNRPDRNVDPPPLTCQFQVFRSVCKSIGLPSVIRFDAQELKKVKWYVLHNNPKIDTYRSQFKSLFFNKDMKEKFPDWFGSQIRQRHVDNDNDPEVCTTSELLALACGPTWNPISINSGICSPGPDGEMYDGQLQEILEFKYLLFKVVLFRVKWFDTRNQGRKVKRLVLRNNMTQIDTRGEAFKNDQYILVTQVKQVFYLEDKAKPHLKVVEHVNHKKCSDEGVIVVEDDPDITHFDNSSDLPLSTSLNDLDNATLHIDGQTTEVDAPPYIIDVVDEDDDIIDDEDDLPHDLADSDDEDLINVDDDGVDKMSADVARSHDGDGGGEDHPPLHYVPTGYGGCFANRGKGKRKPNLGGRAAGRLHTRDKTRNLSLKEITDKKGPVPIRFEVLKKQKAALITDIRTQFDLRPHMESPDKTEINADIQSGGRPEALCAERVGKYIQFWNDPRNIARAAQNWQNRAKSTVIPRQGSRSLARLRDEMRQSSATQVYPSLIDTFFIAHTVNGVFTRDEDRLIYEEMRRLEATGTYTDDEINRLARKGKQREHIPGVGRVLQARVTASPSRPAPESMLKSLHKKVDFMMSLFKSDYKFSDAFSQFESAGANGSGGSGGCGDDEESADDQEDEDEDGDGDS
ncbi:hypothetical protein Tco_1362739 [Tanacetum coccineum]